MLIYLQMIETNDDRTKFEEVYLRYHRLMFYVAMKILHEYNPDELLNGDLKRGISNRPSPRSHKEIEHNVRSHLKSVQLNPDKIKGFFGTVSTRYSA